ncbi:hypothetical protein Pan44_12510 [Caulifigura coniformis]|uniref:DNA ligase D 3'-phosphoesterase domain-containing protein n=1 Tax=Caulifigura coniformis TaxID=2527983 RepID=A0A517SAT3_9PLAN|nr:DNA polymerase ligase N-terminal domain-containing protein [Caulifigura coniformis]QDT53235.1 hypothetical protein Pan44_12510 [Caulifigura coniformis]
MPAFVVLEHDHPVLHWDLMLDAGESLRTWRLSEPPLAGRTTTCESLPDHRRAYLDYEGPVSGGRGTVSRVMRGDFAIEDDTPDHLTARLRFDDGELSMTLRPATGVGTATFRAV